MNYKSFYKKNINLLYIINNLIGSKSLIQPYQRLLICISGGQDSIFLIQILYQLKTRWNWQLAVIHCDHQWNSISRLQANYVSQLTNKMNIDYYQAISNKKITSEETARNWRYFVIKQIAHFYNYKIMVTAHTKNDRIETFLAFLLRGSGISSFQAINWKKKYINKIYTQFFLNDNYFMYQIKYREKKNQLIKIQLLKVNMIRPLLNITREEIYSIISFFQFPIWYDPTNRFLKLSRNRIRHRLIPYMKLYFHPKIDQSIFQWTEISFYQANYLVKLSKYLFNKIQLIILDNQNQKYLALDFKLISCLPICLQRQIIKHFLEKNLNIKIIFHQVEYIRLQYFFLKKNITNNYPKINNNQFMTSIDIKLSKQNTIKLNNQFLLIKSSK